MDLTEVVARLERRDRLPLFAEKPWDAGIAAWLRQAGPADLGLPAHPDGGQAASALAGLFLWNDDFEGSHNLCQGISSGTGSYWHALCHRREGSAGSGMESNLGNSAYWFRRVGQHPAFAAVRTAALDVLAGGATTGPWAEATAQVIASDSKWDPHRLLDGFRLAGQGRLSAAEVSLLEHLQASEIAALYRWCCAGV